MVVVRGKAGKEATLPFRTRTRHGLGAVLVPHFTSSRHFVINFAVLKRSAFKTIRRCAQDKPSNKVTGNLRRSPR